MTYERDPTSVRFSLLEIDDGNWRWSEECRWWTNGVHSVSEEYMHADPSRLRNLRVCIAIGRALYAAARMPHAARSGTQERPARPNPGESEEG